MTNILQSLSKTVHLSLGIAIALLIALHFFGDGFVFDRYFFSWLFRYLHVLTGIMWIGLLWYFNFVQIPSMPNIPDDQKPAIGKVIAPKAKLKITGIRPVESDLPDGVNEADLRPPVIEYGEPSKEPPAHWKNLNRGNDNDGGLKLEPPRNSSEQDRTA